MKPTQRGKLVENIVATIVKIRGYATTQIVRIIAEKFCCNRFFLVENGENVVLYK